jgi:hypothetical protein
MASPPASATSAVDWSILQISLSHLTLSVARLKVPIYLGSLPPGPQSPRDLCWLDSGTPLSVVPFHVHHQRLSWHPIPGITTTWAGQPCDLGRIDVWLQTDQLPYLRGPFALLAKFPHSDPPGDLLPVLLGLDFFLTHQAEFTLLPRLNEVLSGSPESFRAGLGYQSVRDWEQKLSSSSEPRQFGSRGLATSERPRLQPPARLVERSNSATRASSSARLASRSQQP